MGSELLKKKCWIVLEKIPEADISLGFFEQETWMMGKSYPSKGVYVGLRGVVMAGRSMTGRETACAQA